jgi:outer membrane protein assembly factor BamB
VCLSSHSGISIKSAILKDNGREQTGVRLLLFKRIMKLSCISLWFFIAVAHNYAGGWTQYRGSNHDGVSTETIRLDWAANPPKILWKVPMPNGLSSFTAENGRIYTMGVRDLNGNPMEFCIAMDANTGKELWASPVGRAYYPDGGVGPDDGARATPTIEGEFVYAFGAYMNLICFNATTGVKVWNHDLPAEFGTKVIAWQNAASPLLGGDLILVNGNGRSGEHLLAFHKTDGTVAWKTGSDGMTQSTPILAEIGGVQQAIFFAQSGLVSVAPASGAVLWRYALPYNGTSVAASPVVQGDTVYASRAYPTRAGAVVVKVSGSGANFSATKVWDKPNQLMNHWATPVYYNGYYYGIYGQGSLNFRAVDAKNGDTKWSISGFGYGSVTRVSDKLIVLGDDGVIALVDTNPESYTELARIERLEGRCWNNPAISDGRIYARSTTEAVALDVSVDQPAGPLLIAIDFSSSTELTLTVANADNTALDQAALSKIAVSSSDSLAGLPNWEPLGGTSSLTDGKIRMAAPTPEAGTKYFRAERKP